MSSLRVIQIIPTLNRGGAERLVLDICNTLKSKFNIEVLLVVLSEHNEYVEMCENLSMSVIDSQVIPSLSGRSKINVDSLEKLIQQFKPDVIHSHLFEAEITSREVYHKEITYVTHLHDNMHQFRSMQLLDWFSKKRITEFFEKQWMIKRYKRCNNSFIAISKNTLTYFKMCLPYDLHGITLMSNAINFSKFSSKIIRYPKDKLIKMTTIGSLVDKKNQIFLCDVVQYLNQRGYKADLAILGDGKNRKLIEEKIHYLKLGGQITLKGTVPNVEEYLKESSFYVHPATYEPFGLVILEAMAASNVVIALNGHGNLDIHQEGINGFIIDPPNPETFALKLIDVTENPALFRQVAEGGHEFAQQYDINNYCDRLLKFYERAIENNVKRMQLN